MELADPATYTEIEAEEVETVIHDGEDESKPETGIEFINTDETIPTLIAVSSTETITVMAPIVTTTVSGTIEAVLEGEANTLTDEKEKESDTAVETGKTAGDGMVVDVDPGSIARLSSGKVAQTRYLAGYWDCFTPVYNSDGMVVSATCKTCLFSFSPRPFCLEAHLNGNNTCKSIFGEIKGRRLRNPIPKEEVKESEIPDDIGIELEMEPLSLFQKLSVGSCFICGNVATRRRSLEKFNSYPEDWSKSIGRSLCKVLELEDPLHDTLSTGVYCYKCAQLLRDINWVQRSVNSLMSKLSKLSSTVLHRIEGCYITKDVFVQNLKCRGPVPRESEPESEPEPEPEEFGEEDQEAVQDEPEPEIETEVHTDEKQEDENFENVEVKIETTSDLEADPLDDGTFDQTDMDWVPVENNYRTRLRDRSTRVRTKKSDEWITDDYVRGKPREKVKEYKKVERVKEHHKKIEKIEEQYKKPGKVKKQFRQVAKVKVEKDVDIKTEKWLKWNTPTIRCQVPSCSRMFSRPCKAEIHYRKDHERDPKPYHCAFFGCGATFNFRTQLEAHRKTHAQDKILAKSVVQTFHCPVDNCNRVFKDRRLLNHHVQNVHHPKLNFLYCQYCSKSFAKSSQEYDATEALQKHEEVHALNPIPFSCAMPSCSQSFTNSKDLRNHVAWEHDENRYRCSFCPGIAFVRKSSLRQHQRLAHQTGPPVPKQCEFPGCNFVTTKYKNLSSHALSHSEERPFRCDQCTMAYKTKRNLQSHFAMIHSEETPYACKHCDLKFKSSRLLNIHEVTHTGNSIQHLCSGCGKGFRTLSNLTTHINYRCPKGPAMADDEIMAHREKCRENSRQKRARWRQLYGYDRLPTGKRHGIFRPRKSNKQPKIDTETITVDVVDGPIIIHVLPPVSEEVEIPADDITWTTATVYA